MARTATTRRRPARATALEENGSDAFVPSGAPDGADLTARDRKTTDRARREAFFDAVVRPPGNVIPAAASTNAELAAALEEHDRRVVRE